MEQPIRVVAAVSYPLLQAGVQAVLNAAPDVQLVAVTACKHQALALCRQHRPDMLLLNVTGDGIAEYIQHIQVQCPTHLLLLSATDSMQVHHALAPGVTGHVLLDEPPDMLLHAIRTVAKGGAWYSQAIAQKLHGQQNSVELRWQDLTDIERELLRLLAKNYTNVQIAAEVGLGVQTVRNYCHTLYQKLHIHARHEAVSWFYKNGGGGTEPLA